MFNINSNPIIKNALLNLTPDKVSGTYSGKAHSCCCGCAGNHTRPSNRAFKATFAKLHKLFIDNIDNVGIYSEDDPHFFSLDLGKRTYTLYLTPDTNQQLIWVLYWSNR